MNNIMKKVIVVLIISLLSFNFSVNAQNTDDKQKNMNIKNELILSLSIGKGDGKVAYSDYVIDSERFGPESFAIFDKAIYFLDSVENQIEIFGFDSKHIKTIELPDEESFYDMEVVSSDEIVLLNYKGEVITINSLGDILGKVRIDLKHESDINYQTLYKSRNNEIKVKDINRKNEYNINSKEKNNQVDGIKIIANECDSLNQTFNHNNKIIKIKYKHSAGLTYPLKSINDREILFFEEEVLLGKGIYTEGRVSKYNTGIRTSMALLEPVLDDETIPNKYIYCTDNGEVYQMVCKKENINIYKLVFTDYERTKIDDKLENEVFDKLNNSLSNNILGTYTTREEIAELALFQAGTLYDWSWEFDYDIHVSPNNDYCTPPKHLDQSSESGIVTGIPYKWGGFDTMNIFLDKLENGKTAGDINDSSVTSYTTGIDCSGYVARSYRFSFKLGTSTIPSYFDSTTYSDLLTGEIANRNGYHVFIFGYYETENGQNVGCTTLECTTDGNINATKPWVRSLREMNLYTPMKLKENYYKNFDY